MVNNPFLILAYICLYVSIIIHSTFDCQSKVECPALCAIKKPLKRLVDSTRLIPLKFDVFV